MFGEKSEYTETKKDLRRGEFKRQRNDKKFQRREKETKNLIQTEDEKTNKIILIIDEIII